MKNYLLPTIITALIAEIVASWWVWTRWPYDTLDLLYHNSFFLYEAERLLPWIISLAIVSLIRIWHARRGKVASEPEP